jgi:anionic cell wall polymer biosynthesis LytR-Cps2A-Psr (LCP) family protein
VDSAYLTINATRLKFESLWHDGNYFFDAPPKTKIKTTKIQNASDAKEQQASCESRSDSIIVAQVAQARKYHRAGVFSKN